MEVASLTQTLLDTTQRVTGARPVREPTAVSRAQQGTTAFQAPVSTDQAAEASTPQRLGIGIDGLGNQIEPTSLSALIEGEDGGSLSAPPPPPPSSGAEQTSVEEGDVVAGLAAPPPPPPPPPPSDEDAISEEDAEEQQAAGTNDEANAAEDEEATVEDEEGADGLTSEEEAVVRELQARDIEVRRHEQAHAAAGGPYAGSPTYEYERGPDGRQYAVGGEVSIDTSKIAGNPEANLRKFQQIRRAALAPLEPSPQDRRVAAEAQRQISEARAEIRELQTAERVDAAEEAQAQRASQSIEETAEPRQPGEIRLVDPNAEQTVLDVTNGAGSGTPNDITDSDAITDLTTVLSPVQIPDSASRGLQASQAFLRTAQLAAPAPSASAYF